MDKRPGTWILALAMMAPCVLCVGAPMVFLAVTVYKQDRDLKQSYPGAVSTIGFGGFNVNGSASIAYILVITAFLLFVAGAILLLRNVNAKDDSRS